MESEKPKAPVMHSPIRDWDKEQIRRNEAAQGKLVFKHEDAIEALWMKIATLEDEVKALKVALAARSKSDEGAKAPKAK